MYMLKCVKICVYCTTFTAYRQFVDRKCLSCLLKEEAHWSKKFIIEITSCVSTTHTWDSVLSTDDSF